MDISSHYFPDTTEASSVQEFSDASFQIPVGPSSSANLLIDDSMDFFAGLQKFDSPQKPIPIRSDRPLRLQDLTPRPKPSSTAIRSSLKPKHHRVGPSIPSPQKHAVASDLSLALGDALSPLKRHDLSFMIPLPSASGSSNLLLSEQSLSFKTGETDITFSDAPSPRPQDTLTLSQLSPALPSRRPSPPDHPAYPRVSDFTNTTQPGHPRTLSVANDDCLEEVAISGQPDASLGSSPQREEINNIIPTRDECSSLDVISSAGPSRPENKRLAPATKESAASANDEDVYEEDSTRTKLKLKSGPKRTIGAAGITKRTKRNTVLLNTKREAPNAKKARIHVRKRSGPDHEEQSTQKHSSVGTIPPTSSGTPTDSIATNVSAASCGFAATLMSYAQHPSLSTFSNPGGATPPPINPASESHTGGEVFSPAEQAEPYADPTPAIEIPDTGTSNTEDSIRSTPADLTNQHTLFPSRELKIATKSSCPLDRDIDTELSSHSPQLQLSPEISSTVPVAIADPVPSVLPPSSPMRPSVKRSTSAAPSEERSRKKSKNKSGSESNAEPLLGQPGIEHKVAKALHPSRTKNVASGSSGHSNFTSKASLRGFTRSRSTRILKSSTTSRSTFKASRSQHPGSQPAGSNDAGQLTGSTGVEIAVENVGESATQNRFASEGSADHHRVHSASNTSHSSHMIRSAGSSHSGVTTQPARIKEKVSTLPPAKPTQPVNFHFHSEARIEARKADPPNSVSKQAVGRTKMDKHLPIPDLKALNSAQELGSKPVALRTVPVAFTFSTDLRAVEREKFEEGRRAREREAENLAEEKRRLKELEEEREVKEMRKRAVPKANEVPEWYAFAPKRLQKDGGGTDRKMGGSV